jgi:hypothetical protein
MVLLGDEAKEKARFSSFGDSVSLMQDRCMVCSKCTIMLVNHFRHTQWNS